MHELSRCHSRNQSDLPLNLGGDESDLLEFAVT